MDDAVGTSDTEGHSSDDGLESLEETSECVDDDGTLHQFPESDLVIKGGGLCEPETDTADVGLEPSEPCSDLLGVRALASAAVSEAVREV